MVKFQLTPYEKAIEIVKADLAAVTDLARPTPLIENACTKYRQLLTH